ncbi:MAG: hypothetical protein H7Y38_01610 [Armatimonadetes bacterium]|nr:hypothetical protein [Armatimonadota bacterium]
MQGSESQVFSPAVSLLPTAPQRSFPSPSSLVPSRHKRTVRRPSAAPTSHAPTSPSGLATFADAILGRLMASRPGTLCVHASVWLYDKTTLTAEQLSLRANNLRQLPGGDPLFVPRPVLSHIHRYRRPNAVPVPMAYRDSCGRFVFVFYSRGSEGKTGFVTLSHADETTYSPAEIETMQFAADMLLYGIPLLHTGEESERQVRLDEKRRIARDLHDTIVQDATGAVLQLQNASLSLAASEKENTGSADGGDNTTAEAKHHVTLASGLTRRLMERLRNTMWSLHESGEADGATLSASHTDKNFTGQALQAARRLLNPIAHRTGTYFEVIGEEAEMRQCVSRELCHLLTEMLTNVVRHANAPQVRISLTFAECTLTLCVVDNGCGFCQNAGDADNRQGGSGFGLIGMRERVEAMGGDMSLVTQVGRGTRVRIVVPLGSGNSF